MARNEAPERESDETAARVVSILDRIRARMLADGTLPGSEGDDVA